MNLGDNVTSTEPKVQQVKSLLHSMVVEKNIKEVTIIDDAYDKYPSHKDFGLVLLNTFLAEAQQSKAWTELLELGFCGSDENDIDDDIVKLLWDEIPKASEIGLLASRLLVPVIEEKKSGINTLSEFLEAELELVVHKVASNEEFSQTSSQIIFLDYYLGSNLDINAVANAKGYILKIYDKYGPDNAKPLIILMSSQLVTEKMIEAFKAGTGLLGGMFEFVSKQHMSTKTQVLLRLGSITKMLPIGHHIQEFVDALREQINNASKEFVEEVEKLTIDDYVYMQNMSLHEDGQPLGDYMLWLYGSYLGYLLFERNQTIKEKHIGINALSFDTLPSLKKKKPTSQLVEIYRHALFTSVDDISHHPRTPKGNSNTYLRLGDMFFKDKTSDVYLVINAQCDLSFAPDHTSRPFDPDKSILLIPGRIIPIHEFIQDEDKILKTEPYLCDEENYKILWNVNRVISIRYGDVNKYFKDKQYCRKERLRLPYALEVQQGFTNKLTRIGKPVSPPHNKCVKVEFYYLNPANNKYIKIPVDETNSAAVIATAKIEKCLLAIELIEEIRNKMINAVDDEIKQTELEIVSLDKGDKERQNKNRQVQSSKTKLETYKNSDDNWLKLISPIAIKTDGATTISKLHLSIVRNIADQANINGCQKFVLSVIDC